MKRLLLVVVGVLLIAPAIAGTPKGDQILAAMRKQFSAVNDYRADLSLTVKGSKVSINNMQMTVYYKKPNKIHVDAKQGVAMVPSGNYFGDPLGQMANAKAAYLRTEEKVGRPCYVLKLIGGQAPMTAWVDKERSVVVAMDGEDGLKTAWRYARIDGKYYLPTEIRADIRPALAAGRRRHADPDDQGPDIGPTKATLKFSNYKVNKGIDDTIFQEKKRK